MEDCAAGEIEIFTSSWTIAEVCYAQTEIDGKLLSNAKELKIRELWGESSKVQLIDPHQLIMMASRELVRDGLKAGWADKCPDGWKLQPKDAIHLASAKFLKNLSGLSEINSYDAGWRKYEPFVGVKITEPRVGQLRMSAQPIAGKI
jgi:predicted nucleic acid-binding protein